MAFPPSRVVFLPPASSAFSSFHSGHCSVQWLFHLPQWPPARSFSAPFKTFAAFPAESSRFSSLSTCTALSLHFAPRFFSGTAEPVAFPASSGLSSCRALLYFAPSFFLSCQVTLPSMRAARTATLKASYASLGSVPTAATTRQWYGTLGICVCIAGFLR